MDAKFMKTNDVMTWECKIFTYEFLGFLVTDNMEIKLHIHTSYTLTLESNGHIKEQAPFQQVCHQHESMGEWRRMNERIGI